MTPVNLWFWLATIYLFILVYQDYKNKRWVDDRKNAFMLGFSYAVVMISHTPPLYNIGIILTSIIFMFSLRGLRDIGQADIKSLGWILAGLGLFYWAFALYFAAIFIILSLLFILIKNKIFKYKDPVQFYGVIFLSLVCTGFLFRAY